jgi:aspergillopepsin I
MASTDLTVQTTFFDSALAQNLLTKPVFTADLKKGAPGSYDFGFIDDSKHTGDIVYTPVDSSNGFWEFTAGGYGVGSGNFEEQQFQAIADTGTTLILVEDSIVEAYYGQVSAASYDSQQGGYTFDCSTELPDFIIGIGDGQATVPGSLINLAPVDSSGSSESTSTKTCPTWMLIFSSVLRWHSIKPRYILPPHVT